METLRTIQIDYNKDAYNELLAISRKFNETRDESLFEFVLCKLGIETNKCLDCGKNVIYKDTKIGVSVNKKENKIRITFSGKTNALKKCDEYNLCVCAECLAKQFPEYISIGNRVFNRMNKYTKYAFKIPNDVYDRENNKLNARTLENFVAKYGEEEGKKRWDSYVNKCSVTNTFEYKQEKYGWTKEQFDEYNKSRAVTLALMIKRYGEEEGRMRYDEYCRK